MTDKKPEEETKKPEEKTSKCQWCDFDIPASWTLNVHETFATYSDEYNQFRHRHNFSTFKGNSATGKARAAQTSKPELPSQSEKDLLKEYFSDPRKAPASAKLLARKAVKGSDVPALRELDRRYGTEKSRQHFSPVQIVIEGGKPADHNDPRPIMELDKDLIGNPDTWEDDTEESKAVGTLLDPSLWDDEDIKTVQ